MIQQIRMRQLKATDSGAYESFVEQLAQMSAPYHEHIIIDDTHPDKQTFTISKPFEVGKNQIKVWVNGAIQPVGATGAYIEVNGTTIQFNEVLANGDHVDFRIEGAGVGYAVIRELRKYRQPVSGVVDGTNKAFTISEATIAGSEEVYVNGLMQNVGETNDYTISGSTITFNTAPAVNGIILVSYDKNYTP